MADGWVQSLDWTTGLDYWTHPNYKIQPVQCRTDCKLSYFSVTSLTLLPTAFFLEFLEVKGHMHI